MCVHFDLQSGPREHAVDWYKSDTGTECDNKELKFDTDEKKKNPTGVLFQVKFFFFYSLVKPPFLVLFKDTFAVNYSWQRSNSILWGGEAIISYMSGTGRKDFLLQKWHWELNKFTLKETSSNQRLFFTSFKTLV